MATVLVVDDRAANREIARSSLDRGGHQVIEAAEGNRALEIARAVHPDVVLADLVMPGMDGYEFLSHLRASAATADIPVLLYTANYRPDEAEPLAAAYGATRVIAKSADPSELLAAVEEAIRTDPTPRRAPPDLATEHLRTVNAKLVEKVVALDDSEARFRAIAELSPVGIAIGGTDLHATYVNPALGAITAAPNAELLGEGWRGYLPTGHSGADPPLGSAGTETRYGPVARGDGTARWLSVAIRRLSHVDPDATGFVAMVDDVTALVESEQRRHASSTSCSTTTSSSRRPSATPPAPCSPTSAPRPSCATSDGSRPPASAPPTSPTSY
jgi:two-component system cell cycle sensor histidine kinase/response regulator CckA